MEANVGSLDRSLRIVLGLLLIACAALGLTGAWAWIGVVPLLTGVFRFCPAYSIFGFRTCAAPPPKA